MCSANNVIQPLVAFMHLNIKKKSGNHFECIYSNLLNLHQVGCFKFKLVKLACSNKGKLEIRIITARILNENITS